MVRALAWPCGHPRGRSCCRSATQRERERETDAHTHTVGRACRSRSVSAIVASAPARLKHLSVRERPVVGQREGERERWLGLASPHHTPHTTQLVSHPTPAPVESESTLMGKRKRRTLMRREAAIAVASTTNSGIVPAAIVNASDEVDRPAASVLPRPFDVPAPPPQATTLPTTTKTSTAAAVQQRIADSLFYQPPTDTDWTVAEQPGARSSGNSLKSLSTSHRPRWTATYVDINGDDADEDEGDEYDRMINSLDTWSFSSGEHTGGCARWCPCFFGGQRGELHSRRQRRRRHFASTSSGSTSSRIPWGHLSPSRWAIFVASLALLLVATGMLTAFMVLQHYQHDLMMSRHDSDESSSHSGNDDRSGSFDHGGVHTPSGATLRWQLGSIAFSLLYVVRSSATVVTSLFGGGCLLALTGILGVLGSTHASKPLGSAAIVFSLACGVLAAGFAIFLTQSPPAGAASSVEQLWERVLAADEGILCGIEQELQCSGYQLCCVASGALVAEQYGAQVVDSATPPVCYSTVENGTKIDVAGRDVTELVNRQCPSTCRGWPPSDTAGSHSSSSTGASGVSSESDDSVGPEVTGVRAIEDEETMEEPGTGTLLEPLPTCRAPLLHRANVVYVTLLTVMSTVLVLCMLILALATLMLHDRPLRDHEPITLV